MARRYRYDNFGWTTRSSQLYENRLLRTGSPLFHFGILLVFLGHVGGILIPESDTAAIGISETSYHAAAVTLGAISGFMTLTGAAILIYRRRRTGPLFSATTRNDKAMYLLLIATIVAGLGTTVLGNITGHPHDYRLTVAPYFRSIFYFQPHVKLIIAAPIGFQIYITGSGQDRVTRTTVVRCNESRIGVDVRPVNTAGLRRSSSRVRPGTIS